MRTPIFVLSLLLWQSSVDTILERYIRIVGGRDALSRITTRVTKGEIVTAAGRIPWEARFTGVQGQYGTYRVEGNKVIRKIVSAADARNEGPEDTLEFRIEGDLDH